MCNLGYNLSYNTYRGDYTALTEEEKLFVATVAGEMIGEAEITWKIVANVIMNRVGKREWKKYTTVTDVIKYSGFDAYSKNTTEFQKAKQYLNSRGAQTNTRYENLINIVLPIYRKQTTDITNGAQLYYSPKSMTPTGSKPAWDFSQLEEITFSGVDQNTIKVYRYK